MNWLAAVIVPVVAITVPCLIAIVAIITENRVKRQYYESLAKALETGKNPEEIKKLFGVDEAKKKDPQRSLKTGIILIGIGIGMAVVGLFLELAPMTAVGIFMGILGLSFLLIYFLLRNQKPNT